LVDFTVKPEVELVACNLNNRCTNYLKFDAVSATFMDDHCDRCPLEIRVVCILKSDNGGNGHSCEYETANEDNGNGDVIYTQDMEGA